MVTLCEGIRSMKDMLKFLFFFYWNDYDSKATGYRPIVIFCWIMLFTGVMFPVVVIIILGIKI